MKQKIVSNLLYFMLMATFMSQIPGIRESWLSSFLLTCWIVPFLGLAFTGLSKNLYFDKFIIYFFCWIFLVLAGAFVNYTSSYISLDLVRNFSMSLYMVLAGGYFSERISSKKVSILLMHVSYISLPIICGILYFTYFQNYDVTDRVYGYEGKNSIAQILLTCVVLIFFLSKPTNLLLRICKITLILFAVYVIFLLKSRATTLGLLLIIPAVLYLKLYRIKENIFILIVFLIIVVIVSLVFFSENIDFFVSNFLLAGRESSDLNDLSSGRLQQYFRLKSLQTNFLLGRGNSALFIESFPLNQLMKFGILGSIPIFFFLKLAAKFTWLTRNDNSPLILSFTCIFCSYYFNGIFEGEAPFGPGTKCFMLWFLLGFLIVKKHKRHLLLKKYHAI